MGTKRFTSEDAKKLGYFIDKNGRAKKIINEIEPEKIKNKKIIKTESKEKNFIEFALIAAKIEYVKEYKFDPQRRYKFDFAIIDKKIAIEYEGLVFDSNKETSTGKSGHTTNMGYSKNCSKYNNGILKEWRILRYTAINHSEVVNDLKEILK